MQDKGEGDGAQAGELVAWLAGWLGSGRQRGRAGVRAQTSLCSHLLPGKRRLSPSKSLFAPESTHSRAHTRTQLPTYMALVPVVRSSAPQETPLCSLVSGEGQGAGHGQVQQALQHVVEA